MNVKIIQEKLKEYQCRSSQEEELALREITQEVALSALFRTDFFKNAAFQGGTALRIFYGVNRFSEDLDFILKENNSNFSFDKYLKNLSLEFEAYGYKLEVTDRSNAGDIVKKAFLKDDSLGKILNLEYLKVNRSMKKIKIKLEVDTNPPQGSLFENKFLDFPFTFPVTMQDLPSLFAGKIHALLCREYVKGRDWYDFIWYMSKRAQINFEFLASALHQQGQWKGQAFIVDIDWCVDSLKEKVKTLAIEKVKNDIYRFVKPIEIKSIELWSNEMFLDRIDHYFSKY